MADVDVPSESLDNGFGLLGEGVFLLKVIQKFDFLFV